MCAASQRNAQCRAGWLASAIRVPGGPGLSEKALAHGLSKSLKICKRLNIGMRSPIFLRDLSVGNWMSKPIMHASSQARVIRWSQDATNALFATATGVSGRVYRLIAEKSRTGWDWIAWRASEPSVLQSGISSTREDAMQAAERVVAEMERDG